MNVKLSALLSNFTCRTNVVLSMVQNQVVEILVHEHEYFFPGGELFIYLTPSRVLSPPQLVISC